MIKFRNLKRKREFNGFILAILLFTLLFVVLFKNIIFTAGLIEFGDFTIPYTLENYLKNYSSLWNDIGSYSNFQYIPRLILYGIPLIISKIIVIKIDFIVKFLALFPILLSFSLMYILSKFLIMRTLEKPKKNFIPPFISSTIYALNPWVVGETRHFSLIWGYAFLPLIFLLYIKYLDEEREDYKKVFILALLLSFASATPHWIMFSFFVLASWLIFISLESISKNNIIWVAISK